MARIVSHSIEVEFIDCAHCGMTFGMTENFIGHRRKDGKEFYCPDGHSNIYRDNEHDRTRRERDLLKQQLAARDDEIKWWQTRKEEAERTAAARKGVITKLQKRAAAGLCPCCNRSFASGRIARHMATKHPGFKAEEVA